MLLPFTLFLQPLYDGCDGYLFFSDGYFLQCSVHNLSLLNQRNNERRMGRSLIFSRKFEGHLKGKLARHTTLAQFM